jgi:hypothetical protein
VRMLDLFCGRFGWGRAFAARGWEVVGVDLVEPPEIPPGCRFIKADVMYVATVEILGARSQVSIPSEDGDIEGLLWIEPDFICASSPCEQFASFGMKMFQPNPPYPDSAIRLFNHTRGLCEAAGVPYVMENVRSAEQFVGKAVARCGPFALWGSGVPPILPQGITKAKWKANALHGRTAPGNFAPELNLPKKQRKAVLATIPSELASCVSNYAERLLEIKR